MLTLSLVPNSLLGTTQHDYNPGQLDLSSNVAQNFAILFLPAISYGYMKRVFEANIISALPKPIKRLSFLGIHFQTITHDENLDFYRRRRIWGVSYGVCHCACSDYQGFLYWGARYDGFTGQHAVNGAQDRFALPSACFSAKHHLTKF